MNNKEQAIHARIGIHQKLGLGLRGNPYIWPLLILAYQETVED